MINLKDFQFDETLFGFIAGIGIGIPGYILYKNSNCNDDYCNEKRLIKTKIEKNTKVDILSEKVRLNNLRPGPAFVDSQIFHDKRVQRTKDAYTSIWTLVDDNLNRGNSSFSVAITEDDQTILNVVKKLLLEELATDCYSASVKLIPSKASDSRQYFFIITIS